MGKKKDAAKAEKRKIKSRGLGQFPVVEAVTPTERIFTAVDPDNTTSRAWDDQYAALPDQIGTQYDEIQEFLDDRTGQSADLGDYLDWQDDTINHADLSNDVEAAGYELDGPDRRLLRDMARSHNDKQSLLRSAGPRTVDYAAGTVAYHSPSIRERNGNEETRLDFLGAEQNAAAREGSLDATKGEQLELFESSPAKITNLATNPGLKGRGIGSNLTNHAIQAAYDDPATTTGPGEWPPIDNQLSTDSAGMAEHLYGQPVQHREWTDDRDVMDHFFHKLTSMPVGMVPAMSALTYGTRRQYNEGNEPTKDTDLSPGKQIMQENDFIGGTARMAQPPATSLERKTMDLHNADARKNVAANMEMQRMTPLRQQRNEDRAGIMRLPGMDQRKYLP
jgi:ribosomal protein S18 acetylase RimI-like enzyme